MKKLSKRVELLTEFEDGKLIYLDKETNISIVPITVDIIIILLSSI